jgi:hypothetical protein
MADEDSPVGESSATEAEIDGIREAIRLNWAEMEHSIPSQVERHAIRSNISNLVQRLMKLLGGLEPGEPAS